MRYVLRFVFVLAIATMGELVSAQSITEYFRSFPLHPEGMDPDSANEHTTFLIDDKNAFLSVEYTDADYNHEYGGEIAFTYFVRANKTRLFGFSNFFDGPSSMSAFYYFFDYSQGQWKDMTAEVMPEIMLSHFTDDNAMVDSVSQGYRVRLILPRQGTTVRVKILPVGEVDCPLDDYSRYLQFIESLPELELTWQRQEGRFALKN